MKHLAVAALVAGLLGGCGITNHVEYTSASPAPDNQVYLVGRTTSIAGSTIRVVTPWVLLCQRTGKPEMPELDCRPINVKGVPKLSKGSAESKSSGEAFEIKGDVDF